MLSGDNDDLCIGTDVHTRKNLMHEELHGMSTASLHLK
jgi:hypothetical protein